MADPLESIIDAHGGMDYWSTLTHIDVDMSVRGLLFRSKRVRPLNHVRLTVDTRSPHTVLHDFPRPGRRAVLHGPRLVEIRDASGALVEARTDPRGAFADPRRRRHWDALDFTYFCGYAMWCYLTLPFLLRHPGVLVAKSAGPGGTRMAVTFPEDIPTHSRTQELHFDVTGRLVRHDYTAEVVGSWARAVHLCRDYRRFGDLWLPTSRRVYPKGPMNRPLPAPTLVAIDIHNAWPRRSPGTPQAGCP